MAVKGFKRIYPARGRVQFDGGQNSNFPKALIADNESPSCQNVVYTDGAVETRQGTTKVNTAAVGSFVCDGLYTRHDSDGSETMVAWFGGTLWDLQTTSFITVGSAQSIWTAGARVGAAEYEDRIFFGNGYNTPSKYNGTDYTRHGVPAATGVVSAVSATTSTGVLTGDYQYKIAFVNSQSVWGDVGTATATQAFASAKGHLTGIPVAPQSHGVNTRRIYRTETSGTAFKYLAAIADNTTTVYVDNTADASLGVAAPTDNGEPPKYSTIIYHQNRLFMNDLENPNLVWYTDLAEPYTVKSTNFIRIGDNTSDLVRGFAVHDNSLYVMCDKSEWLIYMPSTDSSAWIAVTVKSPYGSKSPFGIFKFNNKIMFPAMQNDKFVGFAAISGDSVAPSATLLTVSASGSFLQSSRIEDEMFDVVESKIGNISAMVYKNKAYISLTDSGTTNNKIWVADFGISNVLKKQEISWSKWTDMNAAQFTIYDSNLYYAASDATGFVYKMLDGTYNDAGAAIDSFVWTKEFSGMPSEEENTKDFRFASIFYENSGAWDMNVTYRTDSDAGLGTTDTIDLDPGGSLWGTMLWGEVWGGGVSETEAKYYLGQSARGRRIQFKFDNQDTVDQKFKIIGLKFAYNRKGIR